MAERTRAKGTIGRNAGQDVGSSRVYLNEYEMKVIPLNLGHETDIVIQYVSGKGQTDDEKQNPDTNEWSNAKGYEVITIKEQRQ